LGGRCGLMLKWMILGINVFICVDFCFFCVIVLNWDYTIFW
jgi:hypothetical protein